MHREDIYRDYGSPFQELFAQGVQQTPIYTTQTIPTSNPQAWNYLGLLEAFPKLGVPVWGSP